MTDPQKLPEATENRVRFTSSRCDILEIKEEDTQPGEVSDSYRKWLEVKYGRRIPPPANGETKP
jgi:hypothetical protein